MVQTAKSIVIAFAGLLTVMVVMEAVDPVGMQNAREGNARAAAERCLKLEAEKATTGEMAAAHVVAGLVAIEMKNNGARRPRGTALNRWARKAASEMRVPSKRLDEFVQDFERAFFLAWKKSR